MHSIDLSWNTTEASLNLIYDKLIKFGLTSYNVMVRPTYLTSEVGTKSTDSGVRALRYSAHARMGAMTALVNEQLERLEIEIGTTGQAIIDLEPGVRLGTTALGDAALACFNKGDQSSDAVQWHAARVEHQVATGALQHLMVQRALAKSPDFGCPDSRYASGHIALYRFQKDSRGHNYLEESIGIATDLAKPKHPLHQVDLFLLKAENTIAKTQSSDPKFLREGNLELGGVTQDPQRSVKYMKFHDLLDLNTQDLINHVVVLRTFAHAIGNQGKLPPVYELNARIKSEIGKLAMLTSGVLNVSIGQLYGPDIARELHREIKRTKGSRKDFDAMTSELNWERALERFFANSDEDVFDQCPVTSMLLQPELPRIDYRKLGRCIIRYPWRPRAKHKSSVLAYFDKHGVNIPADGSFSVATYLFTDSTDAAAQTIHLNPECREAIEIAVCNIMRRQIQSVRS